MATTTIGEYDNLTSVAIDPGGRIVAAGYTINAANSYSDFALVRYNSNGSLDTSFDSDGVVTTRIGYAEAKAVAIQSNGKIVAVGYSAIARYNSDGSLDTTFAGDGTAAISSPLISLESVAIGSDNKIVGAGYGGGENSGDFALGRFNIDGSLDASFAGDGIVTTDFGVFTNNTLNATAIQPDGKIVTVGSAVARYNPDGSRDTTFGEGTGMVGLSFLGYSVATQTDGKIVVAGTHENGDGFFSSDAWLTRLNSDGSPDTSFNGGGSITISAEEERRWFNSGAIEANGKIIAAGNPFVRYNADGSVDTNFSDEGIQISKITLQPDGKIVAAGTSSSGSDRDFALARYDPDGSLDTTFDSDGIVKTPIGSGDDQAMAVTVQRDGKIVAAGFSRYTGLNYAFTIARYRNDGSLDASFGTGGKVITPVMGTYYGAHSVAVQYDGKIVVSGSSLNGANSDFTLVRYNSDGTLDNTSGGGDGISTVDFENDSNDVANGMAIDSRGNAVVVGESEGRFALARFLGDPVAPGPFTVSGRVTSPGGQGLRNALVSLTDQFGVTRTTVTSSFGNYSFENTLAGSTYTISVASRRYQFASRTITINENLSDIDLVGLE